MKRFEIITEADARILERGESILLAARGHITPLAMDTLSARKIVVTREGAAGGDDQALVPVADIRRLAVGSDHAGAGLRRQIVRFLRGRGLAVNDLGTDGPEPVDYPDIAALVARMVARGEADAGIVIDGGGIGSAIAANKIAGIRAAMATSETIARYARQHNGANVLTLGSTLVTPDEAQAIVGVWLTTPLTEPRYIRRLSKIADLERTR
jgi:ribose 5-phosphate isomerase B